MRKGFHYFLLVPAIVMAMGSVALAADSAISTMAGIVMHLNHYPSGSEKETLAGIVHDGHATAGEKTLAAALMNMKHSVGGSDARKLHNLISDDHASKQEKALADVLLGLAHHPSAADKERLQSLMN